MCGRGRAGVRQERTAQYGGRMFVFAATQWVQGDRTSGMGLGLRENPSGKVCTVHHMSILFYVITIKVSRMSIL